MATLQVYATIDSYMNGITGWKDTNYGSSGALTAGENYVNDKSVLVRAIVNYNVWALRGATITSAKMVRDVNSVVGGGFAATIFRCTRPETWTELGVTWNKYDGSNAWTSAGGDWDASTPTPVGFTEASSTGSHDITGLAGFVTDALNNRNGIVSIIMKPDNEDPGSDARVSWYSRDNGGTESYLEIVYTPRTDRERGFLRGVNRGIERGVA